MQFLRPIIGTPRRDDELERPVAVTARSSSPERCRRSTAAPYQHSSANSPNDPATPHEVTATPSRGNPSHRLATSVADAQKQLPAEMQLDSILSTTAPPSSNSSSSGEREGIGRLEELLIGALRTLTHKQDEQVTTSRALQRSILELSDIVQGTLCEGHERQARDLHSLRTDVAGLQSKLDALGRPVTFAEGGEGGGGAGSGGGGAVANWANASRLIHRALSPSPGQGLAGLASESELSGHGGNSCHGGMLTDRSMSAEGLRLGEGSGHGGNSCHEGSGSRHGGSLMLRRFSAPATLEDDQGSFTEGSFKTRRDMNQSPSTTTRASRAPRSSTWGSR